MSEINFKFREYNKRNWYTGVVHASTPKWKEWEDVPESLQNVYSSQQGFYQTLCGTDKIANNTFNLTAKHQVTCMKCLKIMGEQFDRGELTQQTFATWICDDPIFGKRCGVGGKYKRQEILK